MNLDQIIPAVQEALGVNPDGKPGRKRGKRFTTGSVQTRRPQSRRPTRWTIGAKKSLRHWSRKCSHYARALIAKAAANGITIKVISGLRTYDEQNDLYAQGRTKPSHIVSNARGGYSNHNFGIAFDIGVFEGSKYVDESPKYKAVGALGTDLGLE